MHAYLLKQWVSVDNSDGFWNHPSVTSRQDTVGITMSRHIASDWFGSEISESTEIIFNQFKSVEKVRVIS